MKERVKQSFETAVSVAAFSTLGFFLQHAGVIEVKDLC